MTKKDKLFWDLYDTVMNVVDRDLDKHYSIMSRVNNYAAHIQKLAVDEYDRGFSAGQNFDKELNSDW